MTDEIPFEAGEIRHWKFNTDDKDPQADVANVIARFEGKEGMISCQCTMQSIIS